MDVDLVQNSLNITTAGVEHNGMLQNEVTIHYLHFGTNPPPTPTYRYSEDVIGSQSWAHCADNLGILPECSLSPCAQIDAVVTKVMVMLAFLRPTFRSLSKICIHLYSITHLKSVAIRYLLRMRHLCCPELLNRVKLFFWFCGGGCGNISQRSSKFCKNL